MIQDSGPTAAREAERAGLTPRQLTPWVKEGFAASEAISWRRLGVKRAADAAGLREQNVTPQSFSALAGYVEAGIEARMAGAWKKHGFAAEEAAAWSEGGIRDPQVAAEWQRAGVGREQALRYERARQKQRKA